MLPSAGPRAAASQPTTSAHSAFEEGQKLRRNEIVSRILKEEAEGDRRRPQPPARAADRLTLRDRTWGYLATVCEGKPAPVTSYYLVVSPGPSGAQCHGDPTRALTKGPPAPFSPSSPRGRPCGLTSRQAAPLVAACSAVPAVPSGGHGAACLQQVRSRCPPGSWPLLRASSRARGRDTGHCLTRHGSRPPGTPPWWRLGGEGSPRPWRPLQGDRRPVRGQGQP